MHRRHLFALVATSALLAACGGGGGSAPATGGQATYQAVATAGELVSYSIDKTKLTYSYTITESAYGKTGVTGSGTLTANADGTYTPSGFSSSRIKVLDNGLMVGAIFEDLNGDGTKDVVPVMGIANPLTSTADAAGVYNFISQQCLGGSCPSSYGTIKVNADGSWQSCESGNLAASPVFPSCSKTHAGTVSSFASGKADLLVGGIKAGTMILFKDTTNQKVILLDLNGSLGRGALFASSQGFPSSTDGTWHYSTTAADRGTAVVTGNTFTDRGFTRSGYPFGPYNYTLQFNVPWTGLARTTTGNTTGILAGAGMFAAFNGSGNYISVGVR